MAKLFFFNDMGHSDGLFTYTLSRFISFRFLKTCSNGHRRWSRSAPCQTNTQTRCPSTHVSIPVVIRLTSRSSQSQVTKILLVRRVQLDDDDAHVQELVDGEGLQPF
jgi:hypothetical protein